MIDILTLAGIVIVCLVVWFVIFIPVADMRAPKFRGKIEPEQPWPSPPAPSGLYPTVDCGEYRAILADNPSEWLTLRVHYALEAAENIVAEQRARIAELESERGAT